MKIKCPACSAAYRIPDDRIRGKNKVFRVGCKRCGAEIRVRGMATDEDQGRQTMPFAIGLECIGRKGLHFRRAAYNRQQT